MTKTDNDLTAQPGDLVTYAIVVTNSGPSAVVSAPFSDVAPASLVGVSWGCSASAGSTCPISGTGNAINTTVSLLPGGTATFTVTATVDGPASGVIANTANINVPSGVVETAPGNNSATDTTSVTPTADLVISKTDGLTSIAAGAADTYTIVVTNAGPSVIAGAHVTDPLPAAFVGGAWTCTASAGSTCGAPAGTGNINELVTLVSGGTVTYTVTGTVAASALPGTLTNSATVAMPSGSVDPTPANNVATDITAIQQRAEIEVHKTDGASSATPGQPIHYTIVVTNNGPSNVSGVNVVDTMPVELTGATWGCVATPGSTCPVSGSGNIATLVGLLAGGSATFTVDATVLPSAVGTLSNTVTATVPPGVTDPVAGNNSSTDTDTLTPVADLSITKTDSSSTATPGSPVVYTVVVSNAGPSDVVDAIVVDDLPASLSSVDVELCSERLRILPGFGKRRHQHHHVAEGRRHRNVHSRRNLARLDDRRPHQHRDRDRTGRSHRSGAGEQHRQRRRHVGACRRSLDHQDRLLRDRDTRHHGDVSDRRLERRTLRRQQRCHHRHAAGRSRRSHVVVCSERWGIVREAPAACPSSTRSPISRSAAA